MESQVDPSFQLGVASRPKQTQVFNLSLLATLFGEGLMVDQIDCRLGGLNSNKKETKSQLCLLYYYQAKQSKPSMLYKPVIPQQYLNTQGQHSCSEQTRTKGNKREKIQNGIFNILWLVQITLKSFDEPNFNFKCSCQVIQQGNPTLMKTQRNHFHQWSKYNLQSPIVLASCLTNPVCMLRDTTIPRET